MNNNDILALLQQIAKNNKPQRNKRPGVGTNENDSASSSLPQVNTNSGGSLYGFSSDVQGTVGGSTGGLQDPFGNPDFYDLLLSIFGASGDGTLQQLLSSLGIFTNNPNGMDASTREDWNKQLMDTLLNYWLTQENRNYNEGLRDEQRNYEHPAAQLARLMGSGISRDAALQFLAGAGAGSGGSAPYSDAVSAAQGLSPSESRLNGVQADTAIAGAVFGGISSIAGLVQLGFSVPQAIQQTNYLKNQNYMLGKQKQAYESTGKAFQILKNAGAAADAFGSVTSAFDAISSLAQNGNADAAQFIQSGAGQQMLSDAPFTSPALNHMYLSERNSGDYKKQFDNQMALEDLQKQLGSVSVEKAYADLVQAQYTLLKTNAEIEQIYTDIALGNIEVKIAGNQLKVAEMQGLQAQATIDAFGMIDEESGKSGLQMLSYNQFTDLWKMMQRATVFQDNKEDFINYLENNQAAAYNLAAIQYISTKGQRDIMTSENGDTSALQQIFTVFSMLKNAGIMDLIDTGVSTSTDIWKTKHNRNFIR